MRIIFVKSAALLLIAIALEPVAASDLEYGAQKIRFYSSYKKCVAALRSEHKTSKMQENTYVEDKDGVVTRGGIAVGGITFSAKDHAQFTISGWTMVMPKASVGSDGSRFGWGTDWICDGRKMLRRAGHSAEERIPGLSPMPPEPPLLIPPIGPNPKASAI
jgi:hypothetical protein